ncbi:MAG: hypothetical protein KDA65_14940, partial [Planctomycetaceae bacterium]|nr:hypothetical protein [Planctomycetaceae bacterium]
MTDNLDWEERKRNGAEQVVILGASNVAIGLSRLVFSLREVIPIETELKLLIAGGHGRSYGKDSAVFVRRLPGILNCGLWEKLEKTQHVEPDNSSCRLRALLTDIGNDLIYGVSVERLYNWVAECVRRLQVYNADIVMTGVPLESLAQLSSLRYSLTQKLFFPKNSSSHQTMV